MCDKYPDMQFALISQWVNDVHALFSLLAGFASPLKAEQFHTTLPRFSLPHPLSYPICINPVCDPKQHLNQQAYI